MDAREYKIAEWKQLIKVYLGKPCLKRSLDIICDILCVSQGIKPSMLFDYGMPEPESMKTFLTAVISNGLLALKPAQIGILQAGEDLLIFNVDRVAKLLTRDAPIVIDVTGCEGNPRIIEMELSQKIIEEIKTEITKHVHAAKRNNATGNNEILIHKINDSENLNLSTLFGFLLGYPAVYWFDTCVQKDNCLGMLPLTVLSLTGQFVSKSYTITSYSIPENIVPFVKHRIDDLELNVKHIVKDCAFLSNICFSSKSVTLPAVNL